MFPKKKVAIILLAALLCTAGALYGLRQPPVKPVFEMYDTRLAVGTEMPIFYVETDKKAVGLTFDISWGDKTPDKVLDVLSQHDQEATFFISGPWANHYKSIVSRIVNDGHEIASHGQEHINLSRENKETIIKNIQTSHNILVNLTDRTPKYFRPPNGDYDDLVVLTAREMGYETIIWAVDSLDWKNPGSTYIVERVSKLVFPGAVLLFHASDSAKQTHEALPMVLENLKSAGYEILPLDQLMSLGKPVRDDPRGRPLSELPGN